MFNADEIHAITRKISSIDKYLPTGLTDREYVLLALACIDQAGANKDTFDAVLQAMESINVWEEDETLKKDVT
jgi:hypothetical protein